MFKASAHALEDRVLEQYLADSPVKRSLLRSMQTAIGASGGVCCFTPPALKTERVVARKEIYSIQRNARGVMPGKWGTPGWVRPVLDESRAPSGGLPAVQPEVRLPGIEASACVRSYQH